MTAVAAKESVVEAPKGGKARERSRSPRSKQPSKDALKASLPKVTLEELTLKADDPDLTTKAVRLFKDFGCFAVVDLNNKYVGRIGAQVKRMVDQSLLCDQCGNLEKIKEGWVAPTGTLFIPASWDGTLLEKNRNGIALDQVGSGEFAKFDENAPPHARHADGSLRDKQIMVLGMDYFTSADLLSCAMDERALDIVEAISGSNDIEIFGNGQLVYKEPGGGHIVSFHQDSAFFEFEGLGPIGTLNYCVDTNLKKNNGPLYVVPGSHKFGFLEHSDTASHLGLPEWGAADSICVEAPAGTSLFFHQYLIHGSPPNHSYSARPNFINRYTRPIDKVIMPLATSVEMRKAALEKAKVEAPTRERGLMARGERLAPVSELTQLGAKMKGQFH